MIKRKKHPVIGRFFFVQILVCFDGYNMVTYKDWRLNVQECIKPISYVKTNAADMMNFVNDKKEPLIITQNGESRAVLIDVESYQEMKNAFNLLKIIQFSEMDVQAGRTKPAKEVFSNLRRKYKLGKCNVSSRAS